MGRMLGCSKPTTKPPLEVVDVRHMKATQQFMVLVASCLIILMTHEGSPATQGKYRRLHKTHKTPAGSVMNQLCLPRNVVDGRRTPGFLPLDTASFGFVFPLCACLQRRAAAHAADAATILDAATDPNLLLLLLLTHRPSQPTLTPMERRQSP